MSKIITKKFKILANRKITDRYYRIVIEAKQIAQSSRPGQFIEVKIDHSFKPLLRKPFSVHRANNTKVEILYEVLGEGTKILSRKKAGGYLDLIGPLGNGFNYFTGSASILVAGGMGVAPLTFLAERLKQKGTIVLIGSRSKKQIICKKEFQNLGCEVKISTDDGSAGYKGKVTDLLKKILKSTINEKRLPAHGFAVRRAGKAGLTIYACGPDAMLKELARIAKTKNIPAQVSLEAYMACGFGACLGCAVKTESGYKLVCKDGPVFNANEILY